MADLWYSDESGRWRAQAICANERYVCIDLTAGGAACVTEQRSAIARLRDAPRNRCVIAHVGPPGFSRWFVVTPPGSPLLVNGRGVLTGLAKLEDRDVLALEHGGREWVFTTERLAAVEPYAGQPGVFCARCKLEIDAGQPIVSCPGCNALHHQVEDDFPCWTYAPSCAQCSHLTDLTSGDYRWTPDEL